jgi:hypothetical protein
VDRADDQCVRAQDHDTGNCEQDTAEPIRNALAAWLADDTHRDGRDWDSILPARTWQLASHLSPAERRMVFGGSSRDRESIIDKPY